MTNLKVLATTAAAAVALPGLALAAPVLLIDDYSTDQAVADAPIGSVETTSTVGNRTFTVDNRGGTAAFASSLSSGVENAWLDFTNQTGVAGQASVEYNFDAPLDLSNGRAFTVDLVSYDQSSTTASLALAANGSIVERMIGDEDIGTLSFDFDAFEGVDFSSVSSVSLFLDAQTAPAVDIAVDNLGVAPIPLPAGGVLLVGGLAGLGLLRRKRKS